MRASCEHATPCMKEATQAVTACAFFSSNSIHLLPCGQQPCSACVSRLQLLDYVKAQPTETEHIKASAWGPS